MAHEKRTSVKILTSTKKKNISPMLYAFGGFLGGVVLMATLGFTYFLHNKKMIQYRLVKVLAWM